MFQAWKNILTGWKTKHPKMITMDAAVSAYKIIKPYVKDKSIDYFDVCNELFLISKDKSKRLYNIFYDGDFFKIVDKNNYAILMRIAMDKNSFNDFIVLVSR